MKSEALHNTTLYKEIKGQIEALIRIPKMPKNKRLQEMDQTILQRTEQAKRKSNNTYKS